MQIDEGGGGRFARLFEPYGSGERVTFLALYPDATPGGVSLPRGVKKLNEIRFGAMVVLVLRSRAGPVLDAVLLALENATPPPIDIRPNRTVKLPREECPHDYF